MKYSNPIRLIIFGILLWKCLAVNINLPNESYTVYDIPKIIEHYSENDKIINIYLNESKIKVSSSNSLKYEITVPPDVDINIIGKESTRSTFELANPISYTFKINEYTGQKIKIENINFNNIINNKEETLVLFNIQVNETNYSMTFENCNFVSKSGDISIIKVDLDSNSSLEKLSTPQLTINNCEFR
ncbi:hypothetical protein BCR32DRAFT_245468 [Anaeromyces robustus]|uniref:Auto-transporter adhesin head GIN domain-containing protein n=1 Tax=Anaeromyces robustus TaxID=1754192 RepID=A0A1Y1X4E3_9FUNG|nr:hypothetical protein BCR32DRAFT_245468 [Anaeromyces robustus]|eukprot:ORX80653.1 hypothetical protein BCR32DRAFT_245468 [Anaeromyces robustus]